jgi:ElaB/YqjD/DUF883 family membrane-anchored ribosome-binding protein
MAHTSKQEVSPSGIEGSEVLDTVKDRAKEVVAGAADIARAAKDKANEMVSRATAADKTSEAVQDMGKKLTDLLRRYPIQSLGVGFAVGFLLARAKR